MGNVLVFFVWKFTISIVCTLLYTIRPWVLYGFDINTYLLKSAISVIGKTELITVTY